LLTAGSKPLAKHNTIVQRNEESIRNALKLHVELEESKTLTSVKGKRIVPLFCFDAMVAALDALKVSMEFVPEGEADAAVVAVAQRRGAYILGNDSDFAILSAGAPNVRGYIPTEGVQWGRRSTLIPPKSWTNWTNPAVHVVVYSTPALCKHLGVPSNTLAVLSSLVGNDYVAFEYFWDRVRQETTEPCDKPYWRIQFAAKAIQTIPARTLSSEADAVAYVRDIVTALRGQRVKDEVVAKVIAATLQYTLPQQGKCCGAFPLCTNSQCSAATPPSLAVQAYVKAQRAGRLKPLTNAFMAPDRLYPWGLSEDSRFPPARNADISRSVRAHAYSIFFTAVWPCPEVVEYTRNPELRLEPYPLAVAPLESRDACLRPLHERIALYLRPFGDIAARAIGKLPPHLHPLAAALRLCVLLPPVHGSWTQADVVAVTRAALGTLVLFESGDAPKATHRVHLSSRSVQRVAQFNSSLHDMHHVAQALLLSTPGKIKTHLFGWKFIDGPILHWLLSGKDPKGGGWTAPNEDEVQAVVAAALTGLEVEGCNTAEDLTQSKSRSTRRSRKRPSVENKSLVENHPPVKSENCPPQLQQPPPLEATTHTTGSAPAFKPAKPSKPAKSAMPPKSRPAKPAKSAPPPKPAPASNPAPAPKPTATRKPAPSLPAMLVPAQIATKAGSTPPRRHTQVAA
jgi:hypothetical protein